MRVVESQGSYWYLNEDEGWYIRTPKAEGPRESGEWREPEPGDPLYDLERHPMIEAIILETLTHALALPHDDDFLSRCKARAVRYDPEWFPLLCILVSEDGRLVSAPKAMDVR